jgi:hypothetical protein
VARARKRLEVTPIALNFSPSFLGHVELPHVAEFARVVILATEGVKAVILNADGHAGAHSRLDLGVGVAENLSLESRPVEGKFANLIYTGPVDEAAEGYERVLPKLGNGVVVSGSNRVALSQYSALDYIALHGSAVQCSACAAKQAVRFLTFKATVDQWFLFKSSMNTCVLLSSPMRPPYIKTLLSWTTMATW